MTIDCFAIGGYFALQKEICLAVGLPGDAAVTLSGRLDGVTR
jgi:hypothetical protein